MTKESKTSAINPELSNEKIERIYHDWDAALDEMRPFIREVGHANLSLRKYFRRGYFMDGRN
jgi:hypothetical protein